MNYREAIIPKEIKEIGEQSNKSRLAIKLASEISFDLPDGVGIFGGLAVASVVGIQREHTDIDILCPKQSKDSLRTKLEKELKPSDIEAIPTGFNVVVIREGERVDVEVMLYEQTEGKLKLPFIGEIDPTGKLFELGMIDGKMIVRVSKELLIEMKRKSSRQKDKEDLRLLLQAES